MATANDGDNDAAPAVTLTRGELRAMVRAAVREELGPRTEAEYLTAEEVGRLLHCTPQSVVKYCRRDGLPCVRVGTLRRFARADVLAWLEQRRTQPGAHQTKHVRALQNVREFKRPGGKGDSGSGSRQEQERE